MSNRTSALDKQAHLFTCKYIPAVVVHWSENQGGCHLYSYMLNQSHKITLTLNSASSPLASGKK